MTSTIDTRTPAERAYDDLKSGAAYVKPESTSSDPWLPVLEIADNPANNGRAQTHSQILDILVNDDDGGDDEDEELSAEEERVLDVLYPPIPIVRSRDAAHREERLLNILETIVELLKAGHALGW